MALMLRLRDQTEGEEQSLSNEGQVAEGNQRRAAVRVPAGIIGTLRIRTRPACQRSNVDETTADLCGMFLYFACKPGLRLMLGALMGAAAAPLVSLWQRGGGGIELEQDVWPDKTATALISP